MSEEPEPSQAPADARATQKAELEIKNLNEELIKLAIEKPKIRNDDQLRWRIAALVAPLLTAFVAILGVILSVISLQKQATTRREQTDAHAEEANEREFQQALTMATDPIAGPDRRIAGIYQLRRFWGTDRKAAIVGATITSLLFDRR